MPGRPSMANLTIGDLVSVAPQRSQSVMPRRPMVPVRRRQPDAISTTVDYRPTPMMRPPRTPGGGKMR